MYLYHWISCIYIIVRYNKEVKEHLDLKNYIYRPFYVSKNFLLNLIDYRYVFLYTTLLIYYKNEVYKNVVYKNVVYKY